MKLYMSMQQCVKVKTKLLSPSYPIWIINSKDEKQVKNVKNLLLNITKDRQIILIKDKNISGQKTLFEEPEFVDKNINTIVPSAFGEDLKSFANFEILANQILSLKPTRRTILVAIGGGSVGDAVGFLASVILRGIDFIQYPTTLLSMVDSSVGGKTAINTQNSKNMIGSFYQPLAVICDIAKLQSLSKNELLSGYAEVLKYGLLWDKDFFYYLVKNQEQIANFFNSKTYKASIITSIICQCCKIKAKIVAKDERETKGIRSLLNLGHTFGHGIEKSSIYKNKIPHGIAVAFGTVMAVEFSIKLKLIDKSVLQEVKKHYKAVGLEVYLDLSLEVKKEMLKIMSLDKKNSKSTFTKLSQDLEVRSEINLVLLKKLGKAINKIVKTEDIYNYLINDYNNNTVF